MITKHFFPMVRVSRNFLPILAVVMVLCSSLLLNACSPTTVEGGENGEVGDLGGGNPAKPENQAECEELGGRWEVLGFSGPGCNLPSSDGGKVCADHGDCESLCLADDETVMKDSPEGIRVPDHFRIDQINAEGKELEGVCSMWQSDFGCHVVVEKGKFMVICID